MTKELISIERVCKILNISKVSFYKLKKEESDFPKAVKINSTPKFDLADLEKWIDDQKGK